MSVKNPGDDERVLEVNHRAARPEFDGHGLAPRIAMTFFAISTREVQFLVLQFCNGKQKVNHKGALAAQP